jgi:hypothetical protein
MLLLFVCADARFIRVNADRAAGRANLVSKVLGESIERRFYQRLDDYLGAAEN